MTYLGIVLDSAISGESITLKHLHSFLSEPRQNGSQFEYLNWLPIRSVLNQCADSLVFI